MSEAVEQRVSTLEVLRSNPPVAILPIGTIEAHGHHCALGTDMRPRGQARGAVGSVEGTRRPSLQRGTTGTVSSWAQ